MDTRSWQPVLVPSWLAKVKHLPGHWKACTLKEYFCQLKKKKSPHSYGNSLDSAYSPPWPGSIPSQGTKIPQAMWYDQKKKKIIISTIP